MDGSLPARSVTVLSTTGSVCPVCLRRVGAERVTDGENVYLRKSCAEHGSFQTVLWRGLDTWRSWGGRREPSTHASPLSDAKDCPFDCGLCADHRQQTCCAVLEVTARCNLTCPVCFADASPAREGDPDLATLADRCRELLSLAGPVNLQISGGEPTVRHDLPEMIALARSLGFPFVQLNTNGLRLAQDPHYARELQQAGLGCVFLQFDGLSDDVCRAIRGRDLLDRKLQAIRNCGEAELGVVLVPTLVPGVNTDQIGAILLFAIAQMPAVRAVHFQPVSYFGRFPAPPRDCDRITIPEVLCAIEQQTGGLFHAQDFRPPSAENAWCSFQGRFHVSESGVVEPAAAAQTSCCSSSLVQLGTDGARRARQYVARQWAYPRQTTSSEAVELSSFDRFLASASRTLSVSGMAFQDAWNLDLERLRDCFLHAFDERRRLIPLCAWNLTSSTGASLYRDSSGGRP